MKMRRTGAPGVPSVVSSLLPVYLDELRERSRRLGSNGEAWSDNATGQSCFSTNQTSAAGFAQVVLPNRLSTRTPTSAVRRSSQLSLGFLNPLLQLPTSTGAHTSGDAEINLPRSRFPTQTGGIQNDCDDCYREVEPTLSIQNTEVQK